MANKKHPSSFSFSLPFLFKLALGARKLSKRESWTREQIKQYQGDELKKLREFAYANSPFYKQFHFLSSLQNNKERSRTIIQKRLFL